MIVVMHLIIHTTGVFVSIYLGLTITNKFLDSDDPQKDGTFIKILSILICTAILSNSIGKMLSNCIFMSISKKMHKKMVEAQVHAPISHFEENT